MQNSCKLVFVFRFVFYVLTVKFKALCTSHLSMNGCYSFWVINAQFPSVPIPNIEKSMSPSDYNIHNICCSPNKLGS